MIPQEVTPSYLFLSLIYRKDIFDINKLQKLFAPYGFASVFFSPFNPSLNYYSKEMGNENLLQRCFFFYEQNFAKEKIKEIKVEMMKIENNHLIGEQRSLNIDPGVITFENVLLTSSKNFSHRVYLGSDVYIQLEILFKENGVEFLPWTYEDYKSKDKIELFQHLRNKLKNNFIFGK